MLCHALFNTNKLYSSVNKKSFKMCNSEAKTNLQLLYALLSLTGQRRHRQGGGRQKLPKCVIDRGGVQFQDLVFDAKREYTKKMVSLARGGVLSARHRQGCGVNDNGGIFYLL